MTDAQRKIEELKKRQQEIAAQEQEARKSVNAAAHAIKKHESPDKINAMTMVVALGLLITGLLALVDVVLYQVEGISIVPHLSGYRLSADFYQYYQIGLGVLLVGFCIPVIFNPYLRNDMKDVADSVFYYSGIIASTLIALGAGYVLILDTPYRGYTFVGSLGFIVSFHLLMRGYQGRKIDNDWDSEFNSVHFYYAVAAMGAASVAYVILGIGKSHQWAYVSWIIAGVYAVSTVLFNRGDFFTSLGVPYVSAEEEKYGKDRRALVSMVSIFVAVGCFALCAYSFYQSPQRIYNHEGYLASQQEVADNAKKAKEYGQLSHENTALKAQVQNLGSLLNASVKTVATQKIAIRQKTKDLDAKEKARKLAAQKAAKLAADLKTFKEKTLPSEVAKAKRDGIKAGKNAAHAKFTLEKHQLVAKATAAEKAKKEASEKLLAKSQELTKQSRELNQLKAWKTQAKKNGNTFVLKQTTLKYCGRCGKPASIHDTKCASTYFNFTANMRKACGHKLVGPVRYTDTVINTMHDLMKRFASDQLSVCATAIRQELGVRIQALTKAKQQSEKDLAALKRKNSTLAQKNTSQAATIKKQEEALKKVKPQLAAFKKVSADLRKSQAANKTLVAKITVLSKHLKDAQKGDSDQLQIAKAENAKLVKQRDTVYKPALVQLSKLKGQVKKLKAQVVALSKTGGKADPKAIDVLKKQINQLKQSLNRMRVKAREDNTKATQALATKDAQLRTLQSQIAQLQQRLAAAGKPTKVDPVAVPNPTPDPGRTPSAVSDYLVIPMTASDYNRCKLKSDYTGSLHPPSDMGDGNQFHRDNKLYLKKSVLKKHQVIAIVINGRETYIWDKVLE